MIERYEDERIRDYWSEKSKLEKWQRTEFAVIQAREEMGLVSQGTYSTISGILYNNPFTEERIKRWKELEKDLNHDLNAFVDGRKELLPEDLRRFFHDELTSYDTEEPAFVVTLNLSVQYVLNVCLPALMETIISLARRYRYTIMNGRTHGQEAELQSFGKRCLTWFTQLELGRQELDKSKENLRFSKLSGAVGNYQGV